MNVVILPRTTVGRKLLRSTLPFAHDPNRRDGELPDGSSIYGTDFDELAHERDYDGWVEELFPGRRWPGGCDAGDMTDA